jgi:site-specific recombinase XerD
LLVVLWRGGLRCSEALDLRPVDVDFGAGTIRVLHGKGDRARTVGVDDQALDAIRYWLEARDTAGITSVNLFCTIAGGRLSARYVRAMTARLAVRAGVAHRVHPHAMRHTMAVELAQEGWPVTQIQQQLGHESASTTDIYLRHLYPAEVIARARSRAWA